MLIRQSLNFAAHFVGGIVVGGLTVTALFLARHRIKHSEPDSVAAKPEPPQEIVQT